MSWILPRRQQQTGSVSWSTMQRLLHTEQQMVLLDLLKDQVPLREATMHDWLKWSQTSVWGNKSPCRRCEQGCCF